MAAVVTVFMISITNQLLTAVLGVYFTDINHSVLGAGMHLSIFAVGTLTGKAFLLLHRPVESRILVRAGMGILFQDGTGYRIQLCCVSLSDPDHRLFQRPAVRKDQ